MPYHLLVDTLAQQTGVPKSTLYAYLRKLPQLQIEPEGLNTRNKRVSYVAEKTGKTRRNMLEEEIVALLKSQPEKRMLARELAVYVLKKKLCRDRPAFYYRLTRMRQVIKKHTEEGMYCVLKPQEH